jgi:hypothetical protein
MAAIDWQTILDCGLLTLAPARSAGVADCVASPFDPKSAIQNQKSKNPGIIFR